MRSSVSLITILILALGAGCGSSSPASTSKSASKSKTSKAKAKAPSDEEPSEAGEEASGEEGSEKESGEEEAGGEEAGGKVAAKQKGGSKAGGKKRPWGRKPFSPPPLESLPDRGELGTVALGKPVAAFKKLCATKQKKDSVEGTVCLCTSVGEETKKGAWVDGSQACGAAVEGLEAPLTGLQLLGVQKAAPVSKKDKTLERSASIQLLLHTKQGFLSAEVGSFKAGAEDDYPGTFKLVSYSFAQLVEGGSPELLAIFEEKVEAEASEEGDRTGWLVACALTDLKKARCSAPLSLGQRSGSGDGDHELKPVVEEGQLYLVETSAATSKEAKGRTGKYTLVMTAPAQQGEG